MGLDQSLFLMDLKTHKLCNLPKFCQGLFTVWGMFQKSRTSSDSLFWLLKETVLYGTRFNVEHLIGSFVAQRFISAGTVTLKHVFNLTGPNLSNAEKLAVHIGVRSIRIVMTCLITGKVNSHRLNSPCVMNIVLDFVNPTVMILSLH